MSTRLTRLTRPTSAAGTTDTARRLLPNRRQFMRGAASGAALALAAPAIIPSSALGDDQRPAASERLGLGFIGVGKQCLGHLKHYLGKPEVQVLAVCDVDTTRRENAKSVVEKKYGQNNQSGGKSGDYKGCGAYNNFRELLERKDIDAVVIGTPDHWHAIPVIEACRAKKDIYCEKPLTLTIHEAKALIDAVRKHDRVFQTGSQQRSSKEFRTACEYVRSGRIGKVKTIYVGVGPSSVPCDLPAEPLEPGLDWDMWLGQAPSRPYNSILSPRGVHDNFPDWRKYREYSGGAMTDWGAHHFDIAQWCLDMDRSGPVEVHPPEDPKATTGARYVYANGVEMIHGGESGITFVGTEGKLFVTRGKITTDPDSILKQPLGEKDLHLPVSPGHHENWLQCVKSREKPICDVEIGARSVTVCHLGNLAYWHRRSLKWDPQKWEFPGDAEANGWRTRQRRPGYQLPEA